MRASEHVQALGDGEDEVTAARGENHEGHLQIDQSRFSDIRRDELGSCLNSSKE